MIELQGHLTWRPTCDVNPGGSHNEACAKNPGCLRPRGAPLFPPGLEIDQKNPEVALRLDLQHRSIVDSSRNPNDDAKCEFAPGYPRPSEYWSKPRQPLQHGGTRPSAVPVIPLQRPGPAMYTLGFPTPAQTNQFPRRRNPLGRIMEERYGVAPRRGTEKEILAPKPIRPSANPRATSQMSAFLARFTPETACCLDPIWARVCLLYVDTAFFPRDHEMFGDDESSDGEGDGECEDGHCSPRWQNWVERLVTQDEV